MERIGTCVTHPSRRNEQMGSNTTGNHMEYHGCQNANVMEDEDVEDNVAENGRYFRYR